MKKLYIYMLLLSLFILKIYPADLSVPLIELVTRGTLEPGTLVFNTHGNMEILLKGGDKFSADLGIDINNDNWEDIRNPPQIEFDYIILTAKTIPLYISFFTGKIDIFCNGDVFTEKYDTEVISTIFKGFIYFPETTRYDGIHQIAGTGIKLESKKIGDFFSVFFYLYQDSYLHRGDFSSDIRTLFNWNNLKLEFFAGVSFPYSKAGLYRFGMLLFARAGNIGEFLTEFGITRWDPARDAFDSDLFFLLFETRLKFGTAAIILTGFWHPSSYLQKPVLDSDAMDINFNLRIGKPEKSIITGGMETRLSFKPFKNDQINTVLSPYLNLSTYGVLWNFRIDVDILPWNRNNILEFFIGLKAEF